MLPVAALAHCRCVPLASNLGRLPATQLSSAPYAQNALAYSPFVRVSSPVQAGSTLPISRDMFSRDSAKITLKTLIANDARNSDVVAPGLQARYILLGSTRRKHKPVTSFLLAPAGTLASAESIHAVMNIIRYSICVTECKFH